MSLLEIKNLCKEYNGVVPLKNINLTVERGEVISIIGPSGTGKSTLLRCINRLETPSSGAAIARALAMKPQMMLFDEPTSALDPTMVTEVKNVIRHLAEDGMTMLIVTHEMRLAKDISTRVLYMDKGEIYEQGTPEMIFNAPQKELTRAFVLRITIWNWSTDKDGKDFIAMIASLEEFCHSCFMSRKMMNSCELVFEEIYSGYFMPLFDKEKTSSAVFILEAQGENEKLTLKEIRLYLK